MKTQSLSYQFIAVLLRVALILAIFGAVWNVYRRLPVNELPAHADAANETALMIVLRRGVDDAGVPLNIPVDLYSIDVAAIRREYNSEPRPGMRFEDFLARRMKARPHVTSRLDETGQATVMVAPGKWWIRAVLTGTENIEWRLPVEVAGRRQTIELTTANAYARMKSF